MKSKTLKRSGKLEKVKSLHARASDVYEARISRDKTVKVRGVKLKVNYGHFKRDRVYRYPLNTVKFTHAWSGFLLVMAFPRFDQDYYDSHKYPAKSVMTIYRISPKANITAKERKKIIDQLLTARKRLIRTLR